MTDLSGSDLSGVNIVLTDMSGATVVAPKTTDLSVVAAPIAKDLSGAVVLPKSLVAKDLSGAVVLPKSLVAKDLSGAVVVVSPSSGCCSNVEKQDVKEWNSKDLSGALVVKASCSSCCCSKQAKEVKATSSCCCSKKAVDVKEGGCCATKAVAVLDVAKDLSGSTIVTDLSGVVSTILQDLSGASVNDVILALPRLLAAAQFAGAADNSALVKMKHSARALLSQSVKGDPVAATAFGGTYLHAVCSALLLVAAATATAPVPVPAPVPAPVPDKPLAAVPSQEVKVIEKRATTGGRSWFVCWNH